MDSALSPHSLTYAEAVKIQETLRSRVRLQPLPAPPRLVAGVDAAYSKTDAKIYGAAVLMSLPELMVLEDAVACGVVDFPYVPGLLSFREAPILRAALRGLQQQPEVVLVDGHGQAHPRGLGLASYLGLLLNIPTIGCAKSRLWGECDELEVEKGSVTPLVWGGRRLGWVLRSRRGVRPLFISPGHLITLDESLDLVRQCLDRYRLPRPLREAHILSNRRRRQESPQLEN